MQPLRRAGIPAPEVRHDPAPSRISYRLNRIWLSPVLRRIITFVVPSVLVIGLIGLYISNPNRQAVLRGWVADITSSIEARPEFQIRQMSITGASPVLANAIRERVEVDFPVSWFRIEPADIQARIAGLDAVADVQVTVELGGALNLRVTEREPAVIWRRAFSLEMLDETGVRIAYIDRRDGRPDLPLITGDGADAAVFEAMTLFEAAAPINDRLRGLTRRGERRWDVVLDRDQVIQLPEQEPRVALERVLAMQAAQDILNRDIPVIDMRDPERPIVRLGTEAIDYLRLTRAFEKGLAKK
ncbi:cell division protein FtsQ/DivIB [Pseudoruegeria sp. SK021]|uniref:cell division protein FtsQ/DivIB n=1 Tax=Pseudoruegeria sp. SK021 TaxID=1933035 RepID=UPI000A242D01|nr:cell division protein FtsQ/DivIB [Pseudoruegeria sp. SK021]OSP54987.1 hypothetical protein BV911_10080 [Pseudoruegeria sp. SK021]